MTKKRYGTRIGPWLIPGLYAFGAIITGFTIPRVTTIYLPTFISTMSVNAAIGIYSAIASGMIALTGIAFSLAFVMSNSVLRRTLLVSLYGLLAIQ